MINFGGINFSEHHSKEVISFFWRSVYIAGAKRGEKYIDL